MLLNLKGSKVPDPRALKTRNKSKVVFQLQLDPEAITWASPDKCKAGRVGSLALPPAICDSPVPSLPWFPDSPLLT